MASILSFPVFFIGMFFMDMPYGAWISMVLTAPVLFWFGAKHGKANMDTLVALSTGIAFLFSAFNTIYPEFWHPRGVHPHVYYEAASVIIAFISLGKLLEEKAKSNTSSAIPQTALENGLPVKYSCQNGPCGFAGQDILTER